MKELFKKTTTSIIISSIAAFIIGLIMAVALGISLQTIGVIVGIYAIVHGIVLIAMSFTTHVVYVPFYGVVSGLLSIVLGHYRTIQPICIIANNRSIWWNSHYGTFGY